MVHFSKLRLTGFKSFADHTEVDILPGLNGIVGPNGCGKSNLVEAMRWMMGETSAKSLRGGEMDDVIFAGTGKRSSRNFAEVVLTLKNPDGTAPAPYTDVETIEVSRRIDRGMGSDYRINGKVVRAADVQLLFADSSTGASSPAIVSQGRVTGLIQAKPVDRRRVLEEAASISGLHGRRKEAETKLRAAEKNLTRVADILSQKSSAHEQLAKQAKQAERYKTLSETIRRLEALSLSMEWQRVNQEIEAAQASMLVANEGQNQAKQAMYELSKQREGLQAQWEGIERQIQEHNAKMQNVQRDKDRAQDELQRYTDTRADLDQQLATCTHDQAYENEALALATEKLAALTAEKAALQARLDNFTTEVQTAQAARDTARAAYEEAQQQVSTLRAQQATLTTQRQMLEQQANRAQNEKAQLEQDKARIADVAAQLAQQLATNDVTALQQRLQQTENTVQTQLEHITQLEKQAESDSVITRQAVEELQAAQMVLQRIDTEIKALAALAEAPQQGDATHKVVLDSITVESGFEQALSVAFGRELRAGLDDSAPTYWQTRNEMIIVDLPKGAKPLYALVKAPDEMKMALGMIGVVEDRAQGEQLCTQLQAGQMLVSRDGYGWRWDGYTVTPSAQTAAQERETKQILEQRNRLVVLREERTTAEAAVTAAQNAADAKQEAQTTLRQQIAQARADQAQLQRALGQERSELAQAERQQADLTARHTGAKDKLQDLETRLQQVGETVARLQAELAALAPVEEGQAQLDAAQQQSAQAEELYRTKDQEFAGLYTQQTTMQQRLNAIASEESENTARQQNASQRLQNLNERHAKLTQSLAQLQSPDHVQDAMTRADALLSEMAVQQEQLHQQRQDVSRARNGFDAQNQQLQESLMAARETLVRSETQLHNGQALLEQVIERCQQNMGCAIDELVGQFNFSDDDLGQNAQIIRGKQERARAERDRIGAVNLRAEEEATILATEIEALTTEKDDIEAAIHKLRTGIATLNRDARKKMLAAFDEVNARFKDVFTRLFNGGEAYLQLIDAEDPLEAGLEIFAQPPGKRLQTLTLLSGGEQSLTAIALIFAMFLTQPSPICVLDEIDAALDDANVERICSLLQDFARTHPTRFLVITHNPITMAHLHRLYGVTMIEKGVSKLVSVDLERQMQLAANDPHAAAVAAE